MPAHLVSLLSVGRSSDAAYLAAADVARLAAELDVAYRLVGGNAVTLLTEVHQVTNLVPPRETADADMGLSYEVAADPRLLPGLLNAGYTQTAGNRFIRTLGPEAGSEAGPGPVAERAGGPLELVIDVLAPSYAGKLVTSQKHGQLVVDEVPGLSVALARDGVEVDLEVTLTNKQVLVVPLVLPDVLSALCMKAHAYVGRFSERDAIDVWRLLEAGFASGLMPEHWGERGTQRDTRAALNQHFGSATSGGATRAAGGRQARARVAALVAAVVGAVPAA